MARIASCNAGDHQSVFGPVGGRFADKNALQGQNIEPERSDSNRARVFHLFGEGSQAAHGDDHIKRFAMRPGQHRRVQD